MPGGGRRREEEGARRAAAAAAAAATVLTTMLNFVFFSAARSGEGPSFQILCAAAYSASSVPPPRDLAVGVIWRSAPRRRGDGPPALSMENMSEVLGAAIKPNALPSRQGRAHVLSNHEEQREHLTDGGSRGSPQGAPCEPSDGEKSCQEATDTIMNRSGGTILTDDASSRPEKARGRQCRKVRPSGPSLNADGKRAPSNRPNPAAIRKKRGTPMWAHRGPFEVPRPTGGAAREARRRRAAP